MIRSVPAARFTALVLLAVALPALAAPANPPAPRPEEVNAAEFQPGTGPGLSPVILKAQVLLDRARLSPGVIDGRDGENTRKAIAAFERLAGLPADGALDAETWARLTAAATEPILVPYTIARADVEGPFVESMPEAFEDKAELERLAYTGPLERLAEKFHMDEDLLGALNPGQDFTQAGSTIVVARVRPKPVRDSERPRGRGGRIVKGPKVARVEVDKPAREVRAVMPDGSMAAIYPATIGSDEKPAPSGPTTVRAIAWNPNYTYNPDYRFKGVRARKPFVIEPGPNNPVGAVWIDLAIESYGIHGTPEPAKVGKAYSHGCVRLTNWDVEELATLVEKGTPVLFLD
jgi:lipoprotein-anchoring transpeptidase ErfK/SrfK